MADRAIGRLMKWSRIRAALTLIGIVGLVAGCSGGTVAPGQSSVPATPRVTAQPTSLDSACVEELAPFYDTLTELDGRLGVGLNFSDYGDLVGTANVAYQRTDVEALSLECLDNAGSVLEKALNSYISANSAWNTCIQSTDCDADANKTTLQGHWADATTELKKVKAIWP